jgi:hypothetical protein
MQIINKDMHRHAVINVDMHVYKHEHVDMQMTCSYKCGHAVNLGNNVEHVVSCNDS